MPSISVVINTLNEAHNLPRALTSIKDWVDDIVIVDMHSEDQTTTIAKKAGARVFQHPRTGYVEPARNFAISKAKGDWILILDADEEISPTLKAELTRITGESETTYVRIPRKNIVFNKWIEHSRWWPDYNIRFFKTGMVTWDETIHSVPMTKGIGKDLEAKPEWAIIHHHYQTIFQFIDRLNLYTEQQVKTLTQQNYTWQWPDLLLKPGNEFLSRYFAGEGYKDGLHGLALALLQATSELVVYLKYWESQKFAESKVTVPMLDKRSMHVVHDTLWWLQTYYQNQGNATLSLKTRIRRWLLNTLS